MSCIEKNQGFVVGSIAMVIAIVSLLFSLFRVEPITYDWASTLVGVLAILVTVLIGWQIYSILSVKEDIKDIRQEVELSKIKVSTECEILSISIYSALFNEIRIKGEDIYGYFKYGLLVILHAQSIDKIGLCQSMIKGLLESFPVTKPIRNQEKADILTIAAKISDTSIQGIFDELYGKLIVELKSSD